MTINRNAYMREYRRKNAASIKAIDHRAYIKGKPSGKKAEGRRNNRDDYRRFILDFFGGKCVRCGFDDPRALQMDHINGRKGQKKLNIEGRFRYVRNNPVEARQVYQMLCANCNFIKREENKEYRY